MVISSGATNESGIEKSPFVQICLYGDSSTALGMTIERKFANTTKAFSAGEGLYNLHNPRRLKFFAKLSAKESGEKKSVPKKISGTDQEIQGSLPTFFLKESRSFLKRK